MSDKEARNDRANEKHHEGERLTAFVVSDVHLNNHPYDRQREGDNPRRRNFRLFLNRLNQELHPDGRMQLVLNGDILDITGSWFESGVMPWDEDQRQVEAILKRLLLEILENNRTAFEEIRRFLEFPNTEVVYVFGNHDGLLRQYPSAQQVVRDFLGNSERLRFAPCFESPELDLYTEHGHLLDPFNFSNNTQPPLGDVINILIVNRFVDLAVARLRSNGYSEPFIARMHARLHDIEYLRPLALVPLWIQTVATEHVDDPESAGKPQSVQEILIEVISEILHNPQMVRYMTRRLRWPRPFLLLIIKLMLRIPAVLPMVSFITSRIVRRLHSNHYQYKAAQKLRREKGRRLIAFGHTHIPGLQPLSENAYYFNTGSWKPVINLFKPLKKDAATLEYLADMAMNGIQFNKVERAGILKLEKIGPNGKNPAEFSLQTVQSGLS